MPQTMTEKFTIGEWTYEVRRFDPDTFDDVAMVVHSPIASALEASGMATTKDIGSHDVDFGKVIAAALKELNRDSLRLIFDRLSRVTDVRKPGQEMSQPMSDVYGQHWASAGNLERYKWMGLSMKFQLSDFISGMLSGFGPDGGE